MAKRKREINDSASKKKRVKDGSSSPHPHGSFDPDRYYKIKSIIDESKTKYHISWEDDERTGERYEPTWEPKSYANPIAVADWKRQKLQQKPATPSRPRGRPKRIIDSSPETQRSPKSNGQLTNSSPIQVLEIDESQPARNESQECSKSPDSLPSPSKLRVGILQNAPPPSSYFAGEYQQISESQSASTGPPQDGVGSTQSSQHHLSPASNIAIEDSGSTAPPNAGSESQQTLSPPASLPQTPSAVVPDSQTLVESDDIQQPIADAVSPTFNKQSDSSDRDLETAQPEVISVDRSAGNPTGSGNDPQSRALEESVSQSANKNQTYIDLTGTDQNTTNSLFTVTPPQRNTHSAHPYPARPTTSSSAWQSTFPFQTQLPQSTSLPRPSDPRSQALSQPALNVSNLEPPFELVTRANSLPVAPASSSLSASSSFPPVPVQSIESGAVLGTAPAPLPSFSHSPRTPAAARTMASSNNTPTISPLKERLQAMRARHRERDAEEERQRRRAINRSDGASNPQTPQSSVTTSTSATGPSPAQPLVAPRLASPFLFAERVRSPSAVPAEVIQAPLAVEEVNRSGRYETLLPQALEAGGSSESRKNSIAQSPAKATSQDRKAEMLDVHDIPIHFIGHQRDQYPQMVYFYKKTISEFLESDAPDGHLTQEIKVFIERMRHVTLHPDLDNTETLTQYNVLPSQQADWDVRCSAKFRFLKELLGNLKDHNQQIAIVSQPGRLLDVLEVFLRGIGFPFQRQDATQSSHSDSSDSESMIYLFASDDVPAFDKRLDVVIAMDNSVKPESDQVRKIRRTATSWVPYFQLIVPCSVEHIERCLSSNLPEHAYIRALVSGINQYKDLAGKNFDPDTPKSYGSILARYLTETEQGAAWPFPMLGELLDLDSQTDSEVDTGNQHVVSSTALGDKRPRELDAEDVLEASNKRSRVSSPNVVGSSNGALIGSKQQHFDVTHISDSIEKSTQIEHGEGQSGHQSTRSPTEQRLRDLLEETQTRLEEHVKVISDLQYRFEEQRKELLEVTAERTHAIATAQQAVTRLSEESNKMSSLRADNANLREQLKLANEKLLDHTIPERAEFEALRLSAEQARIDKEKSDKRFEQVNNDVAYVRNLYQNSSNVATSLRSELDELKIELESAERKASGEQARLRKINIEDTTKLLRDENKKLKAMLQDRENGLRFRDEEIAKLKEASRGRMGTRGTSVPRSPRLGSPLPNSRQTSPAAGDLRRAGMLHPLRQG